MAPFTDPQRAWAYHPQQPLTFNSTGPLAGLTFSIKDLYGVQGWPLKASSRVAMPAVEESVLVRQLLNLGATALGKTHLHEIALGITGANGFGDTTHPSDPLRISGGSSSGAAVSVALAQVDFALGTDTGGSIRIPAAWCGVTGYKPTKNHPAWSTQGVLPLSVTCDHTGPLARNLDTIIKVHQALSQISQSPSPITKQSWQGVRVGVWLPEGWVSQQVTDATLVIAATLSHLGAKLSTVQLPEMLDVYTPIVLAEAALVHAEALKQPQPDFLPFTLAALRQGQQITPEQLALAKQGRANYRQLLDEIFTHCDVILAPTVPTLPPLLNQDEVEVTAGIMPLRRAALRLTAPFSLLGAPVIALPSQTPYLGVQLVGKHHQDDFLLGLGLALEKAR